MTDITGALLTALINHGQWLLGAVLFLAALGVPLPASVLLLAAGAFARQGVLDPLSAALTGSVAAVSGDLTSYALGRGLGTRLPDRWREGDTWRGAADMFGRWGVWAVLVTRFLLTPLALPVNLLAGSTRYPLARFLLPVVVGEIAWVLLFGGLGYAFAQSWERVSAWADDSAGLLLGAALVALGAWGLRRLQHRQGTAR
ncbi:MAG: DedA family protein [Hydrogenophaga sp.]|uniref:DedA family protein n=1 Tax=Hydrogenophaga sp. TaxID=1904254 RepID=UPI0025BD734A|nr:DedA family protein [Hydrogenophaga sp.]MBT9549304.1 DedA family protein [Hydrogenophaga sp.]